MMKYHKCSADHGLVYKRSHSTNNFLMGYCDADYYGDLDERRSLTGYRLSFYSLWQFGELEGLIILSGCSIDHRG